MADSSRTSVAVIGAKGRMGSQTCRAVEAAPDLDLVAAVDLGDDVGDVAAADVAVVFSVPAVALEHVLACVRMGVHAVVGTTGWTLDMLDQVRAALGEDPRTGVLVAPNFALGAVLLMRFAAAAAVHYDSVEVIELHHPDKVDAPSGTARELAARLSKVRHPEPTVPVDRTVGPREARGATLSGSQVHSVRLPGYVISAEIIFGMPDQRLTIRHDSGSSARPYVDGALLAIRKVSTLVGVHRGLDSVLDL